MNSPLKLSFFLTAFFLFYTAFSQENPLRFSAYLDAYYDFDLNRPSNNQRPYVTQYDRHNEFNINHAWLKANYNKDRIRSEFALQLGTYPINNYSAEPDKLYQLIHSAKMGYKLGEKSWVDVGVMGGHFGYESVLAINRELLSPALATEYTPYYQTGVQYTWSVSSQTELRAVILNGWQNMVETNNSKSVGMAIDQKVGKKIFLSYGNYYGNERPRSGADLMRFHNNFVFHCQWNDHLSSVAILDYTRQDSIGNVKKALFLTYISSFQFSDQWRLAGRYEYIKDSNRLLINAIAGSMNLHVLSLSLEYSPEPNVTLKIEPKFYAGGKKNFPGSDGSSSNSAIIQAGFAVRLE